MGAYAGRRLIQSIIVVIGVSFMAFGVMFLSGDPVLAIVGETASVEQVERVRAELGMDQPWHIQYANFLSGAVRGDFGTSIRHGQPSLQLVLERMPATLQLTSVAMLLAMIVSIPAGLVGAVKRNTVWDGLVMVVAIVGQALPSFWLGILLMLFFGVHLDWLPISGRGDWTHLVLPAVTVAAFPMARNARVVRSAVLEVLNADFIRTAKAKGLADAVIVLRHAFRNALLPVVTLLGLEFGVLLGGTVVVETIFAWPGVGRLIITSIQGRDFPVVQAAVIFLAMTIVVINLMVDLSYAVLNPRIRYQ